MDRASLFHRSIPSVNPGVHHKKSLVYRQGFATLSDLGRIARTHRHTAPPLPNHSHLTFNGLYLKTKGSKQFIE